MRRLIAITALLLAAGPVAAQPTASPFIIPVSATGGSALLTVTPAGVITTFQTFSFRMSAATMAPNNQDIAILGSTGSAAFIGEVTPAGALTTLGTFPISISENLTVDQNGTYLIPLIGLSSIQIGRMDSAGNVTTIVPAPAIGRGKPRGIAVDIGTGGYLVGELNTLFRVGRSGASTIVNTAISINNSIDMVSDARTGDTFISQQNSLVQIDRFGALTTVAGGFNGCFPGLAYDRATDTFVMGGSCASANANLLRVDRAGTVTTIVGIPFPLDVDVYGSRNVSATADPTPGALFSLSFSEPGSPNAGYAAAAAFSHAPGLVLPIGTLDLTPDALFFLTQSVPALFPGFTGTLDANGTAQGGVQIPAGPLQGVRFYVSFVTFTGTGLKAIANTAGFTVQ